MARVPGVFAVHTAHGAGVVGAVGHANRPAVLLGVAVILFAVICAAAAALVVVPALRSRTGRRSSLRRVFTLRERYALRCMFEQVLVEHQRVQEAQHRAARGVGRGGGPGDDGELRTERSPVLHVQSGRDGLRVEHADGLVLRLVGVTAAAAESLAAAVAQHKVELLRRTRRAVVFEVRHYQAEAGDGRILRVEADLVEVA